MNDKILITYASRSGSTAEIAEAISRALTQNGVQVDVLPMQDVKDLSSYRAVVAGSAIRKSKWLPEAMQFIQTHQSELRQKPFATFTVSITLAMSNTDPYRQAVTEWIQPVRAQVKPISEGLFAGLLDFSKLPFNWDNLKLRAVVALGIFPKNDRRDWNAVRTWADNLLPLLLQTN
jgi:menaquinone-dependent protoporphyrinogen oxidase